MKNLAIAFLVAVLVTPILWWAREYNMKWKNFQNVSIDSRAYKSYFESDKLKSFVKLWTEEDRTKMKFTRHTSLGTQEYVSFKTSLSMDDTEKRIVEFLNSRQLHIFDDGTWKQETSRAWEYQDPSRMDFGQIVIENKNDKIQIDMVTF